VPEFRRTAPGRVAAGRGWLGLRANGAFEVKGVLETPLLPPWLALTLLLATAAAMWWREGKA
jgi:hypothetical protein